MLHPGVVWRASGPSRPMVRLVEISLLRTMSGDPETAYVPACETMPRRWAHLRQSRRGGRAERNVPRHLGTARRTGGEASCNILRSPAALRAPADREHRNRQRRAGRARAHPCLRRHVPSLCRSQGSARLANGAGALRGVQGGPRGSRRGGGKHRTGGERCGDGACRREEEGSRPALLPRSLIGERSSFPDAATTAGTGRLHGRRHAATQARRGTKTLVRVSGSHECMRSCPTRCLW